MFNKPIAIALLAIPLLVTAGSAQSPAEQLQKGIYTAETAGDLDSALQIYRQIVNSNPAQKQIAAQAQFLLAQTLLRKGDLNGAASEFGTLARDYPDYRELVASMAGGSHAGFPIDLRSSASMGAFQNGRYHHNATGIEVTLPPGWTLDGQVGSSDGGDMAMLSDSASKIGFNLWVKVDPTPPQRAAERLRGAIPEKIGQRQGFEGYRIENILPKTIGGQPAESAMGEYTEGGQPMREYLAWIYGAKTRAFFFARFPASEWSSMQPRLDQIVATTLVP